MEVVNRKKRCGGGNQMQQMRTGRKTDKLAEDQNDGRVFSLINRSCMSVQILSGWTNSDMKLVRLILQIKYPSLIHTVM